MIKYIKTFTILLAIVAYAHLSIGQEIDARNSSIQFIATNLGIDVTGVFRTFSGSVSFNPENLAESSFEVSIPVKSVNTGNQMRDEHLLEEDFFDVNEFPEITFRSETVEKEDDQWVVFGKLQLKGISKEVSVPFTYEKETFAGEFSLNRNDYGIGDQGFIDTIGDSVKIQIICRLKTDE